MATTNAASGTKAAHVPGLNVTSGLERLLSEADDKMGVLLDCVERLSKLTGEYRGKMEEVERAVSAVARKVGSMEEARSAHASLAERLAARGNVVAPPPQFPPLDSHIDVQQQYVDRILGLEKDEVLAFLRHKVQGGAPQGSIVRSPSTQSFAAHMKAAEAHAAASAAEYASDGGSSPIPRWRLSGVPPGHVAEPGPEPAKKAADKAPAPAAVDNVPRRRLEQGRRTAVVGMGLPPGHVAEGPEPTNKAADKVPAPAAADKAQAQAPAEAPAPALALAPAAGAEGASKRKSIETAAPAAGAEGAGASKRKSIETAAPAPAAGAEGASKRKSVETGAGAEGESPANAIKRKSTAIGEGAEGAGASKRKSIETGAEAEPPAKAIKRASTAGGEDESKAEEPSKAMRRSESKSEARAVAKSKALSDNKAAAEFEEALQREAGSSKGKSAKAQETPTRQMLNSDEYFRHHVARELAEQYLHEKGAPKSLKVVYPFLAELDMPEGNHRHRGSTGLAGALAVAARYIGMVVDVIIMREADSPRSEFDKIFPFYGSNWALAQNKFPTTNKDLYLQSSAYQELCRDTARMSPQIKGFLVMSIDKFRVQKAFGGLGSHVLGLSKEQHSALAEFQRFKQVVEYLLDTDNEKANGGDGEDGPNGSPAASGPAEPATSETAPGS
jgi:hypothetical protein